MANKHWYLTRLSGKLQLDFELPAAHVIAEPLPYEHRVECSQSAEVVSDLFR